MSLEEQEDSVADTTRHQVLLQTIGELGSHIVVQHTISSGAGRVITCPVRRRSRFSMWPRPWHAHRMSFVRLDLYHPLWMGETGNIYREYESVFGNSFMMRAEIELRDTEGLQNVLDALMKQDSCPIRISSS